jgi:hypothetical protein
VLPPLATSLLSPLFSHLQVAAVDHFWFFSFFEMPETERISFLTSMTKKEKLMYFSLVAARADDPGLKEQREAAQLTSSRDKKKGLRKHLNEAARAMENDPTLRELLRIGPADRQELFKFVIEFIETAETYKATINSMSSNEQVAHAHVSLKHILAHPSAS